MPGDPKCPRPYALHRLCFFCGRSIRGCSAYILGRDWVAADAGEMPWSLVREICGICDLTPGKVKEIYETAGHYPGTTVL